MFRSRTNRPAGNAQPFVVAAVAVVTGAVLLLSGALDDHSSVDIDPSGTATTVTPTQDPGQSVMVGYLAAQKTWIDCVNGDESAATCGTGPVQPDDPNLNAYLSDVLDWNKCAAPSRLRRGGMDAAVEACGPQPVSPVGG